MDSVSWSAIWIQPLVRNLVWLTVVESTLSTESLESGSATSNGAGLERKGGRGVSDLGERSNGLHVRVRVHIDLSLGLRCGLDLTRVGKDTAEDGGDCQGGSNVFEVNHFYERRTL